MKNTILSLLLVIAGNYTVSAQGSDKLKKEDFPADITAFVATNFSKHKIKKIELDKDDSTNIKYDVYLNKKVELEFSNGCELEEIEMKKNFPTNLIPKELVTYVEANYPEVAIVEWELDKQKGQQEIKLINKKELIFNLEGVFISVN